MQFSGIEIHLLKMVFEPFLKRKKKNLIVQQRYTFLRKSPVSKRKLMQLIERLTFRAIAALPAHIQH